jgi:hypothetical protein
MKKIILFITLSLGLTLSSCAPCKDTMCGDNTICENGVCNCLPDFKKNNLGACVTVLASYRDRFVGNWTVDETCDFNTYFFSSSISKHPTSDDQIIISNLHERYTVYATMVSTSRFEIPFQVTGSTSIVGSGRYVGSPMKINYVIESFGNSSSYVNCDADYFK